LISLSVTVFHNHSPRKIMRCIENHASPGFACVRMSGSATQGVGGKREASRHAPSCVAPKINPLSLPIKIKFLPEINPKRGDGGELQKGIVGADSAEVFKILFSQIRLSWTLVIPGI